LNQEEGSCGADFSRKNPEIGCRFNFLPWFGFASPGSTQAAIGGLEQNEFSRKSMGAVGHLKPNLVIEPKLLIQFGSASSYREG
jgi:hypothetical protein